MTMNESVLEHEDGWAKLPDGGQLAYQLYGLEHPGDPVLLIRPLGGTSAIWGSFRALLAERFRLICFDYRGAGRSSPAPALVTTRGLARDALALLDHLGVRRVDVFGISLGAMTATWLAILAPDRIDRLCIASAPARGIEFSWNGLGAEISLATCILRPSDEMEACMVTRLLSRQFRESHPDELRRIERAFLAERTPRASLVKFALAAALHDARSRLSRIRSKTLVLAGGNDELLGTERPRALAAAIPGATFEIIDDAGHDLTLEQPALTAARLASFLAEG